MSDIVFPLASLAIKPHKFVPVEHIEEQISNNHLHYRAI